MLRSYFIGVFALVGLAATDIDAAEEANIFEQPMMFRLAENRHHDVKWISAIGTITLETPSAFEQFTKNIKDKNLWIEFTSPGGKVVPALILGDMIRQRGFNSDVAFTVARGHGKDKLVPGFCFSACGYAFLGGIKRKIQDGSVIGYHQVYKDPKVEVDEQTEAAMIESVKGHVERYLTRMGVDSEILERASATKPADYYEPDSDELVKFRIVTGGKTAGDADEAADTRPATKSPITTQKRSDARSQIWEKQAAVAIV
jgi:hypothetical protein